MADLDALSDYELRRIVDESSMDTLWELARSNRRLRRIVMDTDVSVLRNKYAEDGDPFPIGIKNSMELIAAFLYIRRMKDSGFPILMNDDFADLNAYNFDDSRKVIPPRIDSIQKIKEMYKISRSIHQKLEDYKFRVVRMLKSAPEESGDRLVLFDMPLNRVDARTRDMLYFVDWRYLGRLTNTEFRRILTDYSGVSDKYRLKFEYTSVKTTDVDRSGRPLINFVFEPDFYSLHGDPTDFSFNYDANPEFNAGAEDEDRQQLLIETIILYLYYNGGEQYLADFESGRPFDIEIM